MLSESNLIRQNDMASLVSTADGEQSAKASLSHPFSFTYKPIYANELFHSSPYPLLPFPLPPEKITAVTALQYDALHLSQGMTV